MTPFARRLLTLLTREPARAEVEEVAALLCELTALEARLQRAPVMRQGAASVTRARIASSASLTGEHGASRESVERARAAWLSANARVVSAIADDATLSLEGISALNAAVCERSSPSVLRQTDTQLDMEACASPADVPLLLAPMLAAVEARTRRLGPLWGAGLLYQWLISVHPFEDGNGRTARLAADWLLGQSGRLPMSFATPSETFVALHASRVDTPPPVHAARVVALAVLRSARLLTAGAVESLTSEGVDIAP